MLLGCEYDNTIMHAKFLDDISRLEAINITPLIGWRNSTNIAHLIHSMYWLYVRRAVQIWVPYNGPDLRCVFVCLPLYKNLHIIISSKHTISATEASSDVLNRVGGQLSAHSGNIVLQIIRTLMISEDIPLQHPAPQRFIPTTSHKNSWHFVRWFHNWMPLLTSICKG